MIFYWSGREGDLHGLAIITGDICLLFCLLFILRCQLMPYRNHQELKKMKARAKNSIRPSLSGLKCLDSIGTCHTQITTFWPLYANLKMFIFYLSFLLGEHWHMSPRRLHFVSCGKTGSIKLNRCHLVFKIFGHFISLFRIHYNLFYQAVSPGQESFAVAKEIKADQGNIPAHNIQ